MRATLAVVVPIALALVVGCGGSDESPPAPAKPSPAKASPEPPKPAPPAETPPPAPAPSAPAAGEAGDPAKGAPLYATYCASCHGATGDGDGPVAAGLSPKPAAHSDPAYMDALSDEQLVLVIAKGGMAVGKSPLMSGWAGTLDDQQILDVVAFIRTLSR